MRRYLRWIATRPTMQAVSMLARKTVRVLRDYREYFVIAVCLLSFTGLNAWIVTYEIGHSQHAFCQLLTTLTSVKPPPAGSPGKNPSRAYNLKVEADLLGLERAIGC